MFRQLISFLAAISVTIVANHSIGMASTESVKEARDEDNSLMDAATGNANETLIDNSNIRLKELYAPYYFNNLINNYGENKHYSCGYVATAMLLSFWDTYWDDNVVEERYETHSTLPADNMTLDVESPGATREDAATYQGVSLSGYYANITKYKNDYLHYFLLDRGKTLFNIPSYPAPAKYGMARGDYVTLLEDYIYDYRGYNRDQVEIVEYSNSDPRLVKNKAIEYVQQGIPVKLSISGSPGGHAVIAYDYDSASDDLFCHFGWESDETHLTIESKFFDSYDHIAALIFKNDHSDSNNYVFKDGSRTISHCPCELMAPKSINDDFDFIDVEPTYSWTCYLNEKWFWYKGHFELRFLRSDNYKVFRRINAHMGYVAVLTPGDIKAISENLYYGSYIAEVAFYGDIGNEVLIGSYGRTCYMPQECKQENNVFLELSNPQKSGSTWAVAVKNKTCVTIQGQYNRKMCNFDDAKNWTSALHDIKIFELKPLSSTILYISENWFATSITVSTIYKSKRFITYGDNLKNGSLKSHTNRIAA